jgi:uncharacterized membrane protein YgcG
MHRLRVSFALLFLVAFASVPARARELHWDSLSVKARLEADGRLQVEERQVMVFTGDWNGGERTFNIRPRQELAFGGMWRVDAESGAEIPMQQGSLDVVDGWELIGRDRVRWRARNAADPQFDNTKITYVLRYALSNVLLREDDRYVLDHDFAFSDREGAIEHFQLELTLDPAWQTFGALQENWSVDAIPPGKSFVLRVPLRFVGSDAPSADDGLGDQARMMLAALALIPLVLLAYSLLREASLGRLQTVRTEDVSRSWLEQNLLRERPEVIGAMWDEKVGAEEVSATLARMVAEGRLTSNVKAGEMDLTLNTRKDLEEYEQALLDGLFFRGNHTSTEKIQKHYADSGFDPAALMAEALKRKVQDRLPKGDPVQPSKLLPTLLFFASIAAFVYTVKEHSELLVPSLFIIFGGLFASVFTLIAPNFWRTRKSLGLPSALLAMVPAALIVAGVAFVVRKSASTGSPNLPLELQLALTLFALWIFATATHTLRSRESRESIAFLKMLGTAREYFRRELQKARPALDDAWYPYLLAFGLNSDVQRWFRSSHATAVSRVDRSDSSSDSGSSASTSSSSSSPSSWSGGGGAFGGAGASGTWAMAAAGMAAGVAAPSSSSSDGGSSSSSSSDSGGSSGGGGGGGW